MSSAERSARADRRRSAPPRSACARRRVGRPHPVLDEPDSARPPIVAQLGLRQPAARREPGPGAARRRARAAPSGWRRSRARRRSPTGSLPGRWRDHADDPEILAGEPAACGRRCRRRRRAAGSACRTAPPRRAGARPRSSSRCQRAAVAEVDVEQPKRVGVAEAHGNPARRRPSGRPPSPTRRCGGAVGGPGGGQRPRRRQLDVDAAMKLPTPSNCVLGRSRARRRCVSPSTRNDVAAHLAGHVRVALRRTPARSRRC